MVKFESRAEWLVQCHGLLQVFYEPGDEPKPTKGFQQFPNAILALTEEELEEVDAQHSKNKWVTATNATMFLSMRAKFDLTRKASAVSALLAALLLDETQGKQNLAAKPSRKSKGVSRGSADESKPSVLRDRAAKGWAALRKIHVPAKEGPTTEGELSQLSEAMPTHVVDQFAFQSAPQRGASPLCMCACV